MATAVIKGNGLFHSRSKYFPGVCMSNKLRVHVFTNRQWFDDFTSQKEILPNNGYGEPMAVLGHGSVTLPILTGQGNEILRLKLKKAYLVDENWRIGNYVSAKALARENPFRSPITEICFDYGHDPELIYFFKTARGHTHIIHLPTGLFPGENNSALGHLKFKSDELGSNIREQYDRLTREQEQRGVQGKPPTNHSPTMEDENGVKHPVICTVFVDIGQGEKLLGRRVGEPRENAEELR